ncbi:hypothetical protein HanRHA438_Chr03g0143181 [Helianthus annuus]|nr:hypothetical protein HanIR_Chr03g0143311 [Helianthus annuus]KAJ0937531.1 hypothetical protein HanRHA438_Chr03g0143181 [Helianthus annuus]
MSNLILSLTEKVRYIYLNCFSLSISQSLNLSPDSSLFPKIQKPKSPFKPSHHKLRKTVGYSVEPTLLDNHHTSPNILTTRPTVHHHRPPYHTA